MSYDILLESNLDLPESSTHTTGIAIVAQRVKIRLSTFLGEWMLDRFAGLDFVKWVTNKLSRKLRDEISIAVRREILTTPGVLRVKNYTVQQDGLTLRITGRVIATDGGTFDFAASPTGSADSGNASPLFLYQLNTVGGIAPR